MVRRVVRGQSLAGLGGNSLVGPVGIGCSCLGWVAGSHMEGGRVQVEDSWTVSRFEVVAVFVVGSYRQGCFVKVEDSCSARECHMRSDLVRVGTGRRLAADENAELGRTKSFVGRMRREGELVGKIGSRAAGRRLSLMSGKRCRDLAAVLGKMDSARCNYLAENCTGFHAPGSLVGAFARMGHAVHGEELRVDPKTGTVQHGVLDCADYMERHQKCFDLID